MTRNKKIGLAFVIVPLVVLLSSIGYAVAAMITGNFGVKELFTTKIGPISLNLENATATTHGSVTRVNTTVSHDMFINIILWFFRVSVIGGVAGLCVGIPIGIYFFRKEKVTHYTPISNIKNI